LQKKIESNRKNSTFNNLTRTTTTTTTTTECLTFHQQQQQQEQQQEQEKDHATSWSCVNTFTATFTASMMTATPASIAITW
jgi:uncharacterized protein (DUF2345 family)